MIDVHIIDNPATPADWKASCRESIDGSVMIHYLPQMGRSIGENRKIGFEMGDSPYVSYVDDDDVVLNDAFDRCAAFLDNHPEVSVAGTLEGRIINDNIITESKESIEDCMQLIQRKPGVIMMALHHIIVFRRDAITPHLDELTKFKYAYPEKTLLARLWHEGHRLEVLPFVGYAWRVHNDNTYKSIRRNVSQEWAEYTSSLLKNNLNTVK